MSKICAYYFVPVLTLTSHSDRSDSKLSWIEEHWSRGGAGNVKKWTLQAVGGIFSFHDFLLIT
jgi:hypothetical protein